MDAATPRHAPITFFKPPLQAQDTYTSRLHGRPAAQPNKAEEQAAQGLIRLGMELEAGLSIAD